METKKTLMLHYSTVPGAEMKAENMTLIMGSLGNEYFLNTGANSGFNFAH